MGNDFDENDTLGETDRRVRIKEFGSESSCDTVQRYTASSADLEAVERVSVDLTSHPPFFLDAILIHICAHPNSFANLIMILYAAYTIWSGPRPGGLTLRLRDSWGTEVRGWSSLAKLSTYRGFRT